MTHRRIAILSMCAVGWLSMAQETYGQSTSILRAIEIPNAVSCANCSIRITQVTSLAATSAGGELATVPTTVRRDQQGRYWVITVQTPPQLFGADGKFLKEIGRKGSGPGEYLSPLDAIPLPGDSVLVIDGGNRRANVLSPSLSFVRQVGLTIPPFNSIVLSWPNALVGYQYVPSPTAVLPPLHWMSLANRDAVIERSFGPGNALSRTEKPGWDRQLLATVGGGAFVTGNTSAYRLHTWNASGQLQKSYARYPSWFQDSAGNGIGAPTRPPSPALSAVASVADSLLWVFASVPSLTWRKAWTRVASGVSEVSSSSIDFEELYDTQVELIDLRHQSVVARASFSGLVLGALNDGTIAAYQKGIGGPRVNIQRVELIRSR